MERIGEIVGIADTEQAGPTRGRAFGSTVGAVFGLVFVVINSGGLPMAIRIVLLALAALAFLAVLLLAMRDARVSRARPSSGNGPPFGRGYWIIVAVEAVALFVGARLVSEFLRPELGVAWVSFVVGVHFFSLGWLFRLGRFHVLAVLITACGIAGFVLGALGLLPGIAIVSGVLPGFVLLAFALWAMLPAAQEAGRPS